MNLTNLPKGFVCDETTHWSRIDTTNPTKENVDDQVLFYVVAYWREEKNDYFFQVCEWDWQNQKFDSQFCETNPQEMYGFIPVYWSYLDFEGLPEPTT